jgi:hypothetical protein
LNNFSVVKPSENFPNPHRVVTPVKKMWDIFTRICREIQDILSITIGTEDTATFQGALTGTRVTCETTDPHANEGV